MKILNRNSTYPLISQSCKILNNESVELLTSEVDSIISLTQSWKCCKCRSENYVQKWTCSHCRHERCRNCVDLMG